MNPTTNNRRLRIVPWNVLLKPWPFWSQLHDWTTDPQGDVNAQNNCGPESVAMCLRFLTGVSLPAAFVKDVLYGESYVGYTDVPDLEKFFETYCETPATTILTTSAANQAWWEWKFLRQGKPLIGLFYGYQDAQGALQGGHFRAVIGQTRDSVTTADPWTGAARVETVAEHWTWSKGLLIGVDRIRRLGNHGA